MHKCGMQSRINVKPALNWMVNRTYLDPILLQSVYSLINGISVTPTTLVWWPYFDVLAVSKCKYLLFTTIYKFVELKEAVNPYIKPVK